eukprot:259007-Pelagomonas_calceolata.AAC.1
MKERERGSPEERLGPLAAVVARGALKFEQGPQAACKGCLLERKRKNYTSGSHLKRCDKEGPTPTATRARTQNLPSPGRGRAYATASHFNPPVTYPPTWASSAYYDSKSPKITPLGAVGHRARRSGQKVGFTPRLIRHACPNWHLLNPCATDKEPKLEKCQLEHICRKHAKNTYFSQASDNPL